MSELATGETAPAFTLSDANGKQISLDDYADQQVIVYFYPKAATPGCTTEACDFRDNINSLAAAGYQVIGLSPDDPKPPKHTGASEKKPLMGALSKAPCVQHSFLTATEKFSTHNIMSTPTGTSLDCATPWVSRPFGNARPVGLALPVVLPNTRRVP